MIMTDYYDAVLALIPLTLIGVTVGLLGVGFSLTAAVPIGASLSVLLIGHAMFVRAPVGPTTESALDHQPTAVGDIAAD